MMTAEGGKRATIGLEEAAEVIEPLLQRERPGLDSEGRRLEARRWLTFECLGSGIVEEIGGRQLRFWHLTFQEYLAALQLALRGDGHDEEHDWWPVVIGRLESAQWRETIELLPGCLLDEGGVDRVDRLLERVLGLRKASADLETEARIAGILGRLLRPVEVLEYKPAAEIATAYEHALESSMAIFERETARSVPVQTRIAAAEALGSAGDPRLAAGSDEQRLLEVPGLDGWRLGRYRSRRLAPGSVPGHGGGISAFRGGVGLRGLRPLGSGGLAAAGKNGWDSPKNWASQLEHPSRQVIYVSWYEADAYCRWLGTERGLDSAFLKGRSGSRRRSRKRAITPGAKRSRTRRWRISIGMSVR